MVQESTIPVCGRRNGWCNLAVKERLYQVFSPGLFASQISFGKESLTESEIVEYSESLYKTFFFQLDLVNDDTCVLDRKVLPVTENLLKVEGRMSQYSYKNLSCKMAVEKLICLTNALMIYCESFKLTSKAGKTKVINCMNLWCVSVKKCRKGPLIMNHKGEEYSVRFVNLLGFESASIPVGVGEFGFLQESDTVLKLMRDDEEIKEIGLKLMRDDEATKEIGFGGDIFITIKKYTQQTFKILNVSILSHSKFSPQGTSKKEVENISLQDQQKKQLFDAINNKEETLGRLTELTKNKILKKNTLAAFSWTMKNILLLIQGRMVCMDAAEILLVSLIVAKTNKEKFEPKIHVHQIREPCEMESIYYFTQQYNVYAGYPPNAFKMLKLIFRSMKMKSLYSLALEENYLKEHHIKDYLVHGLCDNISDLKVKLNFSMFNENKGGTYEAFLKKEYSCKVKEDASISSETHLRQM